MEFTEITSLPVQDYSPWEQPVIQQTIHREYIQCMARINMINEKITDYIGMQPIDLPKDFENQLIQWVTYSMPGVVKVITKDNKQFKDFIEFSNEAKKAFNNRKSSFFAEFFWCPVLDKITKQIAGQITDKNDKSYPKAAEVACAQILKHLLESSIQFAKTKQVHLISQSVVNHSKFQKCMLEKVKE